MSSGLEPIFAASYRRKILDENGSSEELFLTDYAVQLWREMTGNAKGVPPGFVTVNELAIHVHLDMQAALQPFVDNSISKTINVPEIAPSPSSARSTTWRMRRDLKAARPSGPIL